MEPVVAVDMTPEPLSAKAIVLGLIVDVVTTFGASFGVSILFAIGAGSVEALERVMASPSVLATSVAVGLAFTAFAGFVTGAIAGHRDVDHALVLGVLEVTLAVVLSIFTPAEWLTAPSWYYVVPVALTIPASGLGGWLRALRRPAPRPGRSNVLTIAGATVVATVAAALVDSGRPSPPAATPPVEVTPEPAWGAAPQGTSTPPSPQGAARPRELAMHSLQAPLMEETAVEARGAALKPPRFPALEGAPDSSYQALQTAGPRFGGDAPAPEWREAARLPKINRYRPELRFVGDRRRVAFALKDESSIHIVDAGRTGPLEVPMPETRSVGDLALSGNRLLIVPTHDSGIFALDLDRGELLADKLPVSSGAALRVCELEPRRALADSYGVLYLLDVGRMRVVAKSVQDVPVGTRRFTTDGLGRWIYLSDHSTVTVRDPAREFQPLLVLPEEMDDVAADPAGRFVFSRTGVRRAGSLERVDAPPGQLLGRLSDGSLLVRQAGGTLERRDPLTARRLGEPLSDTTERETRLVLLSGTDRLLRIRLAEQTLFEVRDVPLEPVAPRSEPPRLDVLPPAVFAGDEWTYAPEVSDPAAATVEVQGPAGLTWDGTTARWRPTAGDVGDHALTITARVAGQPARTIVEPLSVRLRSFTFDTDLVRESQPAPRALPSGRLVVWHTKEHLWALEPGTWRVRKVPLVGCRSVAEIGDSLWVAAEDGGLVELSCPELIPRTHVSFEGAAPTAVAGLPDGRVGWLQSPLDPLDPGSLRLGRFRPGAATCDVIDTNWPGAQDSDQVWWWDAERLFVGGSTWRWGASQLEQLSISNLGNPPTAVLPDGTLFVLYRLWRADGTVLREHERAYPPLPSHDGRRYVVVARQPDRSLAATFHEVTDGKLLGSVPIPMDAREPFNGVLLASRANALVGYRFHRVSEMARDIRACTITVIPYTLPGD